MAVLSTHVDATGEVFAHPVRVRGVQLVSGTSVAFTADDDGSSDPVVVASVIGAIQEIPGCGVDVPLLYATSTGSGKAILYYD